MGAAPQLGGVPLPDHVGGVVVAVGTQRLPEPRVVIVVALGAPQRLARADRPACRGGPGTAPAAGARAPARTRARSRWRTCTDARPPSPGCPCRRPSPVVISSQASPLVGGAARRARRGAAVPARHPGVPVQLLRRGVHACGSRRWPALTSCVEPRSRTGRAQSCVRCSAERCRPRRAPQRQRDGHPGRRAAGTSPASAHRSPEHRARRWETLVDIPPACGPGRSRPRLGRDLLSPMDQAPPRQPQTLISVLAESVRVPPAARVVLGFSSDRSVRTWLPGPDHRQGIRRKERRPQAPMRPTF